MILLLKSNFWNSFTYLFIADLSLNCCSWAFSSCGQQGLLSSCRVQASHCGYFSSFGAQDLGCASSVVVACGLSCSEASGIFLNWDQVCVLCIGREILYHWANRKSCSKSILSIINNMHRKCKSSLDVWNCLGTALIKYVACCCYCFLICCGL